MQDLNKYISGLLFIHDCVILPGFGGFISNYKNAKLDDLSYTLHPPKKDILFNKNLTYNDGLLINYLSRNLSISYREAEDLVKTEVQKAWFALEEENEVVFEGIGKFEYDKSKNLSFTPNVTENYLTESYGLSSFRFPPLNYEKSAQTLNSSYNSIEMNNGFRQTLKWAAIAIPIVGILALVPYVKNNKQEVANLGFTIENEDIPIENTHSAMVSDTNISGMINQTTDKRTALFYAEEPKIPIKKPELENKTFFIIGASYKDVKNANQHAEEFAAKGYNTQVIETNNLFRVSIASFDSKVNALHELRRLRNTEQNDNVWLYAN